MSHKYSIVEPHPSATKYISTGRGGFGNLTKTPSNLTHGSNATGAPSRISLSHPHSRNSISTGRGGFGNHCVQSERTIFSFDEELERQLRRESDLPPIYHVGRGGAGNVSYVKPDSHDGSVRRKTSDSASAKSDCSTESGADVATRNLKRGLQKMGIGKYMPG